MSIETLIGIIAALVVVSVALGVLVVKIAEARGRAVAKFNMATAAVDQAQKVIDVQNQSPPTDAELDGFLRRNRDRA